MMEPATDMARSASGPLAGVRVIDLSDQALGPIAGQILGDMGADVIKVEPPTGAITRQNGPSRHPNMSSIFLTMNRNKRSLVLDLKRPAAMQALMKLVETADVFLNSMRQSAAKRLGVSYQDIAARNPRIIYAFGAGYRQDGPNCDRPAFDDVIQGESGAAGMFAWDGAEPRYVPMNLADKLCGHILASAISMALFSRERTGEGQQVYVPMLETMASFNLMEHLYGYAFRPPLTPPGYVRALASNRRPFATKDGYICVLAIKDAQWKRLLRVFGKPELADGDRFSTQVKRNGHIEELYAIVAQQLKSRTTAEWKARLDAADIPNGLMNRLQDLPNDPYLVATGFFINYDHPTEGPMLTTAIPVQFSRTKGSIRVPPPSLGEHTRPILEELGYSDQDIRNIMGWQCD